MTFKKHNPGCPCACGGEPPTGPCGCPGPARLTISNADALFEILGIRFSPGPCNFLEFTGIDAIEGEYEIPIPNSNAGGELIRVAATNNPQEDDFGNRFCLYARLYYSYLGPPNCTLGITFEYLWVTLFDPGDTCPDLEDVDFTLFTFCPLDPDDNLLPVCESRSGSVACQTANDPDCAEKFYNFDWDLAHD